MADNREERRIHLGNSLTPGDIALIRDIVDVAADQIVTKRLIAIGIDPNNPLQTQSDMLFLRSRREIARRGGWHALTVIVALIITGIAVLLWSGFKVSIK